MSSSLSSTNNNNFFKSNILPGNNLLETPSNNSQLQYFDLDTSNPPPPPPQINRTTSSNSFSQGIGGIGSGSLSKLGTSLDSGGITRQPIQSGVVYNSVDFLKTEAFKRIREDAEKNRMKD